MKTFLQELSSSLNGELFFDKTHLTIYSTDASAYKETPIAVSFPKNKEDIKKIINFARKHKISIIPRGAGTSLAGQVVGKGLIVDVSKYMNKLISLNIEKKQVTIQPGVILSELNKILKKFDLFFGPEASTANRCTMGGMLGNNACGLHSLAYGSTRDYTHSVKAILSNNEEVEFAPITASEFKEKMQANSLEGRIYKGVYEILKSDEIQKEIEKEYPDKEIPRRNSGYALDLILNSSAFKNTDNEFNFSKLMAGSEGTLAFVTEITLNLVPLPPKGKALVVAHFTSLEHALRANLIARKFKPSAIELADNTILTLAKQTKGLEENTFFLKGNPEAILIIEFNDEMIEKIRGYAFMMKTEMIEAGFGYHFPLIVGKDIEKVWHLRRAGLGVLSNMPGDARPVSLIEDTAINVKKLPAYIADLKKLLKNNNLSAVYHAHIGTGELHIRPILNLKKEKDRELFHKIGEETAKLVKKYRGSLSGEHGDGRLRSEFLEIMYGKKITNVFRKIKDLFEDTENENEHIFNIGKIVNSKSRNNEFLRYEAGQKTKNIETIFDFSETQGYLRAVEKCNGSGDCRKTELTGGTMCPSYMATRNEKNTTRARANLLRDVLTNSKNPFENKDVYNILDLCLSCKACKTECPSNVDVTKLKAEFLQQYYDKNSIPLRTKLIANITKINNILSKFRFFSNIFLKTGIFAKPMMFFIGFSTKRKMPTLSKKTLKKYYRKTKQKNLLYKKTVYLFADEFTNFNDADVGIKAIQVLNKLGYKVLIPEISESGRTYLSKALLRDAKNIAKQNLEILKDKISEETPLVGIEPSAILSFRDEYPDFFGENIIHNKDEKHLYNISRKVAKNTFMIDEFLSSEMEIGNIKQEQFTENAKEIKLHGHCQQKSIASTKATLHILSFPKNYSVSEIPSGCCGMAGSFGYEKEHYDLSMKIGELVLFPEIRKSKESVTISAPGTSCRHQIKDGTNRDAQHPIEILWEALA